MSVEALPPPDPALIGTEYRPRNLGPQETYFESDLTRGLELIVLAPCVAILSPLLAVAWIIGRLTRRFMP